MEGSNDVCSFTDQEEQSQSHQKANERVHGLVADRAQENLRAATGHAQRGNIEKARSPLENPQRRGAPAVHRRGREAPPAAHARIPRLQIQTAQEDLQTRSKALVIVQKEQKDVENA